MNRGPVKFSKYFEPVSDADEEIFILYSEKQRDASDSRGLGYVDSHKDVLEIKFDILFKSPPGDSESPHRKRKAKQVEKTVEIELHQDKTALRSRKGDTGSVVWRASVDFVRLILEQCYSNSPDGLLDYENLDEQHILELGAGTGFLSIALSPLAKRYTATDISSLVSLIQKNVSSNFPSGSNISVQELDWISLESTTPLQRVKIFDTGKQPIDLLLAIDCLYHPALIQSFVAAIDYLTTPGQTAVLIVSELRADDVMREFLETWLNKPSWEIWRIPNDNIGKHYVIWLGWKSISTT